MKKETSKLIIVIISLVFFGFVIINSIFEWYNIPAIYVLIFALIYTLWGITEFYKALKKVKQQ